MRTSTKLRGGIWAVGGAALLLCSTLAFRGLVRDEPREVLMRVRTPFSPPITLRDRLGRWIPGGPAWAWAYRCLDVVFGQRPPVKLNATVFTLGSLPAQAFKVVPQHPAQALTNGLAVWFLAPGLVKTLNTDLDSDSAAHTFHARMLTADGIGASMFSGESVTVSGAPTQVGLKTDYFARVKDQTTDLFVNVLFSQAVTNQFSELGSASLSIVTNVDLAARMQVPKGLGVLLIQTNSAVGKPPLAGLILDPL